jgi:hypothetical protein
MLFDEVITNDPRYTYKFILTQPIRLTNGAVRSATVRGSVREKGDDFIKLRIRNGLDHQTDLIIPKASILYIEQTWLRE